MQDEIFAAVHRHIGTDCDWQPMAAGSGNRLFLSRQDIAARVLRIAADTRPAPGIDAAREAALLALLQGRDWAPRVRGCDPDAGWLLMDWHGQSPAVPLATPLRSALFEAVAQWQQIDVTADRLAFDYPRLFDHYRRLLLGLPPGKALLQLVERLERGWEGLPGVPAVLTHHDLHAGNLCVQRERLVVLDWEYGACGCPWFDAAALAREFGASVKELSALPAFASLDGEVLANGLARARRLLDTLDCLWYWARGLAGSGRDTAWLMRETLRLLKDAG